MGEWGGAGGRLNTYPVHVEGSSLPSGPEACKPGEQGKPRPPPPTRGPLPGREMPTEQVIPRRDTACCSHTLCQAPDTRRLL